MALVRDAMGVRFGTQGRAMNCSSLKIYRRATHRPEEIRADVESFLTNARFDIIPEERRARTRTQVSVLLPGLRIDNIDMVGGDLSGTSNETYRLGFLSRGSITMKRPTAQVQVPDVGIIFKPGDDLNYQTSAGTQGVLLGLAPEHMLARGRTLLGDGFRVGDARSTDMRNAAGQALKRNVLAMLQELSELEKTGLSGLAATSFSELITNLAIAAMMPEHWLGDDRIAATPRVVDLAGEMIAARAHEPLLIHEVAQELGVTVRTLQLGFRKHMGCTPLEFLQGRRLLMARQRLLNPEMRSNVQHVAMSCGFVNMGRFSQRYKATFGELPSATRERVRRLS